MRSYNIENIIISRKSVGESDRIVTLFTSSHGKLSLYAKGIRKSKSRRTGLLELFNHVKASVHARNSGLDILGEVQLINSNSGWKKHLGRVSLAYQLVETIDRLTPENQPHPELFTVLSSFLQNIGNLGSDWQAELSGWTVEVIRELGFWPKDQPFKGDVYNFIKELSSHELNSSLFLSHLKSTTHST